MAGDPVALLGAGGTMGLPMARHIARSGIELRAWNRTRDKAVPVADEGARVCESPQDAAQEAGVILTMLSDADAVISSAREALPAAREDAVWLQMSTIGEQGTDQCMELARAHDALFLDSPVLGTKQPAEEGQLVILSSGPTELRDRVQPIFDAIGSKTIWVGDAGAGTRLKIATNSWVLTVTEGCAETIALAQGLGLDPALLFEAFEGGTLDLPYFRIKGKAIMEQHFDPMFRLALAAKDADLVVQAARRHELDLPLFATIKDRMEQGAAEHGDKDMSATWLTSAPQSVAA